MKLRADGLNEQLQRNPFPPLLWIYGEEPLLQIEAADQAKAAARKQNISQREVIFVNRYFTASSLREATAAMSLFSESKLIELRFPTSKVSKDLGEALVKLLPTLDEQTRILATSPERLDRTVTASDWFKQIDKHAWLLEIFSLDRTALPQWINSRLMQQGQSADKDLAVWIAEKVEGNLVAASQEIKKLALLCPPGKLDSSAAQAAVLTVARYDANDVVNASLASDLARALRGLDGLKAEGEPLPLIIWSLSEATRSLIKIVAGRQSGQSMNSLLAQNRIFGPRERVYTSAAQRLSGKGLDQALLALAQADRLAKGIQAGIPAGIQAGNQTGGAPVAPTDAWVALANAVTLLSGKSWAL